MIDLSELDALEADLRGGLVDDVIDAIAADDIRAMAEAARDGIRAAARRHKRTGKLERAIELEVHPDGVRTTARVVVGDVGPIIVHGQRAHEIRALHSPVLAFAGPVAGFATSVHHPGVAPDPFVARGLAAAAGDLGAIADDAAHDTAARVAARLEA